MLNKHTVLLITLISCSVFTRYIPVIYTDMPFSNDVWPLIDLSKSILTSGHLNASSGRLYYHAQWPLSIVLSAVFSAISDIDVVDFYKYHGNLISGLSLVILGYSLANRFFSSRTRGLVFASTISLFPSLAVYTSVFLKETYTHLIMLVFLVSLLLNRSRSISSYLTISILTPALVLGNPLTPLILSTTIMVYVFDNRFESLRRRLRDSESREIPVEIAVFAISLLLVTLIYNMLFVKSHYLTIEIYDVFVLALYGIGVYVNYVLLGPRVSGYVLLFFTALSTIYIYYTMSIPLSLGLLINILLFIALVLWAKTRSIHTTESRYITTRPLLLVVLTIFLYITTYFTIALSILHRVLNYLVYAVAVYVANLTDDVKKSFLVSGLMIFIFTIYMVLIVIYVDPLFFYWRYSYGDRVISEFTRSHILGYSVYGDVKYTYYISDLVESIPLEVIIDKCDVARKWFMIYSRENILHGFPLTPLDYVKPNRDLFTCSSLFFNNGYIFISG